MHFLSKYDIFEITFPFIYFPDKNIRYVQGEGTIKRAHVIGIKIISNTTIIEKSFFLVLKYLNSFNDSIKNIN
jgi:hypothetical protein